MNLNDNQQTDLDRSWSIHIHPRNINNSYHCWGQREGGNNDLMMVILWEKENMHLCMPCISYWGIPANLIMNLQFFLVYPTNFYIEDALWHLALKQCIHSSSTLVGSNHHDEHPFVSSQLWAQERYRRTWWRFPSWPENVHWFFQRFSVVIYGFYSGS